MLPREDLNRVDEEFIEQYYNDEESETVGAPADD
jgi:V/A-type H+-transporting ATPase subunit B